METCVEEEEDAEDDGGVGEKEGEQQEETLFPEVLVPTLHEADCQAPKPLSEAPRPPVG